MLLKPDESDDSGPVSQTLSQMEEQLKDCTSKLQVYLIKKRIRKKKTTLGMEVSDSSPSEREPSAEPQPQDVEMEDASSERAPIRMPRKPRPNKIRRVEEYSSASDQEPEEKVENELEKPVKVESEKSLEAKSESEESEKAKSVSEEEKSDHKEPR